MFVTVICTKVWQFTELKKVNNVRAIKGIGTDFFNIGIRISDDVLVIIPDFSIYVILAGLLINLFSLYRSCKKAKQHTKN